MEADLIVHDADELITLSGSSQAPLRGDGLRDLKIIQKGSIAVRDGVIVATGTTEEIKKTIAHKGGVTVLDASGKTVIPGLVDPHTHLLFAGAREDEFHLRISGLSYMEIAEQGGGILRTVKDTRKASKDELISIGLGRLDEILARGTTTVEIKSGYGLTTESEIKMLEAIKEIQNRHPVSVVATFLGAHALPGEYANTREQFITQIIEEMLPEVSREGLAEFCDIFCEKGVFTVDESRKILKAGQEVGLAPKIHADELFRSGGTQLAGELNARSADHLCFAAESDLDDILKGQTIAVLLPATPFFLMAPQYADARKIIEKGVPVALATDFNPTSSISSMIFVISLACLKMRMDPAEALAAATINAAHAINRSSEFGSLEVGKVADMVILNVPTHRDMPFYIGKDIVHTVIKKGHVAHSK
jgi:imidazolonepropionase